MLLDRHIFISAAQPAHARVRPFIAIDAPAISAVSSVGVLGSHQRDAQERQYLEESLRPVRVFSITSCSTALNR
jgi:hypothetical protein